MPTRARRLAPVHIGCSGWSYPHWRERFYPHKLPARLWLEFYSQQFTTVEVNATFYRLVNRDAVARWVGQTPPRFEFAVKASRYLTHIKHLAAMTEGVARFYARIEPLIDARRLGCVLWQLPETFHRDDERLAAALLRLPPGRHAFEFRHASWFSPDVYALLREHGACLVVGDHPQRPFQTHVATTDWRYVRLHHGSRGRRGNYSRTELDAWARRVHAWRSDGDVFVYFNNDWEAFAPSNATWLERRLRQLASVVPPRQDSG